MVSGHSTSSVGFSLAGETRRSLGGVGSNLSRSLSTAAKSIFRPVRLEVRTDLVDLSGVVLLEERRIGVGTWTSKFNISSSSATSTVSKGSGSSKTFSRTATACLALVRRLSSAGSMVSIASALWAGMFLDSSSHSTTGNASCEGGLTITTVVSLADSTFSSDKI